MLIVEPSANCPIEVYDSDSGNKWKVTFYYRKGGITALAFDCPESVRVFNTAKKAKSKKGKNNEISSR